MDPMMMMNELGMTRMTQLGKEEASGGATIPTPAAAGQC